MTLFVVVHSDVTHPGQATSMHVIPDYFDDPVAAYDELAPNYAAIAQCRAAYLHSIEHLVVSRVGASKALLDIGSGDGLRALRMASQLRIKRVVLVEPSAAMAKGVPHEAEVWPLRVEDLDKRQTTEMFEVVTCLWNVLGHVPTEALRICSLTAISGLLSSAGRLFIDVNQRYNMRSYGIWRTLGRYFRDQLAPAATNGDVVATWKVGESRIRTYGHVFTHKEMLRLADSAGLELEERIVVDYDDGGSHRFPFVGNFLYVFRRSLRIASSTAPQTS